MQNKTVKWAIVGCGRITERRVAPIFHRVERAQLAAFCSRDLTKAKSFAERFGAEKAYESVDELLADKSIEAVYLATPNLFHTDQTCRSLAAGKHVLVEKPMALSAVAAGAMIEAAQQADRLLGIMQQQRFHPANAHLIRLHNDGELGRLLMLRVQIAMWLATAENWRGVPKLSGGGVTMDLAPHALDLMLQIGGEVTRVDAAMRNLYFPGPTEDFCAARLEFANGAVGLLDLSYCGQQYGGRVEAFGNEATFFADGSMQATEVYHTGFRRGSQPTELDRVTATTDCYQATLQDFTDAILDGGQPTVCAADGLRVMQTLDALYASARSGRPVDVIKDE